MKRRPELIHRPALRIGAGALALSLPIAVVWASADPAGALSTNTNPAAALPTVDNGGRLAGAHPLDKVPPGEPPSPSESAPAPTPSTTPSADPTSPTPSPTDLPTPSPTPTEQDTDGDGLVDSVDQCPDQAGPEDNGGCPPATYVALGDSYSAGEGDGAYLPGTDTADNHCHRSTNAYPVLADAAGQYQKFEFHACRGATTAELTAANPNSAGEPTQFGWLGTDTRVVTLSIGGNDIKFADVLSYCVTWTVGRPTCQARNGTTVDNQIAKVAGALPDLFQQIRQSAPHATVLVVGYPRFFPAAPPLLCPQAGTIRRSDMLWINAEVRGLDEVIRTAAAGAGLTYVDNYDAFDGTELCHLRGSTSMYGVRLPRSASFHPTPAGQRILAQRLLPFLPVG